MIICGFIAILLMGVTLGLLGAGGSILTVPILVYLFDTSPTLATSYSLLLVGFTALAGSYFYFIKKQIDFDIAIKFAIPSIISVYITRRFLLPIIPNNFVLFNWQIDKDLFILLLFAAVMLLTSYSMIKGPRKISANNNELSLIAKNSFIVIEAVIVGFVTAIIGAGGGFLIVPALILLNKINVKTAIGSSLLIIAAKSLSGFVGDIQGGIIVDYVLATKLLILAAIGMFLGVFLSKYISPDNLKKWFGYFVMIASILIIIKEIAL